MQSMNCVCVCACVCVCVCARVCACDEFVPFLQESDYLHFGSTIAELQEVYMYFAYLVSNKRDTRLLIREIPT